MIEIKKASINTESLMKTIHEDLQEISKLDSSAIFEEKHPFTDNNASTTEEKIIPEKDKYSLRDFLGFSNEDFIVNGCRVILQREPNDGEFSSILESLESGEVTKVEVLSNFRFSPEGRQKKVTVAGLYLPFIVRKMGRIPVIGKGVQVFSCVCRLPTLRRNILQLNNNVSHLNTSIETIQQDTLDELRYVLMVINKLEKKFTSWEQLNGHQTDILLRDFLERQQAENDKFLHEIGNIKADFIKKIEKIKNEMRMKV